MRYIEIDGERYDVKHCKCCPCYDAGDCGYWESCKHPKGDGEPSVNGGCVVKDRTMEEYPPYGPNCPLREKPAEEDGCDGQDEMVERFREIDRMMGEIAYLMWPFLCDETFDPDARFSPLEHQIRSIAEEHGVDWDMEVRG